jgi:hypothetical protein
MNSHFTHSIFRFAMRSIFHFVEVILRYQRDLICIFSKLTEWFHFRKCSKPGNGVLDGYDGS